MSDEARYFRVGIFVFAGLLAVAATALVLGGRNLFAEKVVFEAYFDESVQGLEVGSPVKRRGVRFGTVRAIGLVEDFYEIGPEQRFELGQLVLVRVETAVDRERERTQEELTRAQRLENLRAMVERGLRLQLTRSAITGVAFIEASFLDPERYPPLVVPWEPEYLVVPAAPSTIAQLTSAAERIMARLEAVNVEQVIEHLDGLLVNLRDATEEVDLAAVQAEARTLLAEVRETNALARRQLAAADVGELSTRARQVLAETETTLAHTRRMIEGGRYDLGRALENLRVATENLRDLTDTLRSQPSLLLRGEPPEPTTVEPAP